jgi:hypothetical protein
MANIEHATIPEPYIHEPKGVASALIDQVYQANGAGSGSWKTPIKRYKIPFSPAAVPANTTVEQTFLVSGLVLAMDSIIGVSKPTAQAGLGIVGWRVSADNTIGITFSNNTGGSITPTAGQTYTILVHRA